MNLRRKIETDPRRPVQLLTVYGVGYKLTDRLMPRLRRSLLVRLLAVSVLSRSLRSPRPPGWPCAPRPGAHPAGAGPGAGRRHGSTTRCSATRPRTRLVRGRPVRAQRSPEHRPPDRADHPRPARRSPTRRVDAGALPTRPRPSSTRSRGPGARSERARPTGSTRGSSARSCSRRRARDAATRWPSARRGACADGWSAGRRSSTRRAGSPRVDERRRRVGAVLRRPSPTPTATERKAWTRRWRRWSTRCLDAQQGARGAGGCWTGRGRSRHRRAAPAHRVSYDSIVRACLSSARREQLTPYVAPPALLFVTTPPARRQPPAVRPVAGQPGPDRPRRRPRCCW